MGRATARQVSLYEGAQVYGGTPDDLATIEAIRDLKARGLKVVLYPFVLMDIVSGNSLPDPYGGTEQAALPWRGRITSHPAPGLPGTPDGTDAVRDEIAAFFGAASQANILVGENRVDWAGGDTGYRRMILHHAGLALAAGGVDGFLIGSELTGLTRLRDGAGKFPFVAGLCALADEVKAMLGAATVVTYGADWSEYFGYHPADGSGDVSFHLDELWAHPAIGAVGIDNYMPLSDWRDADLEKGNPDGARHGNDRAAMRAAITSGEGYDWYYANVTNRAERNRTPISDGLSGKDWVYRFKDIRGWWQNVHYNRAGGVETAEPTAWVPASKPVWMTELGCPAVDKGAVQPNVFPDQRSSEGALPYFSTGARDDSAQKALISAHLDHWNGPANADGMVDPAHIHLWTWDARPYPAFPAFGGFWADGINWRGGHWLNGRLGGCELADLIAAILAEAGFERFDVSGVTGAVTGHVVSGIGTARNALEPLLETFCIDIRESPSGLEFISRLRAGQKAMTLDVIADPEDAARFEQVRAQTVELPSSAVFRFFDPASDHESAAVRSRRPDGGREAEADLAFPGAIDAGTARLAADLWLSDCWASRRRLSFALPLRQVGIQPGDTFRLSFDGAPSGLFRITRIEDAEMRRVEALGHAALPLGELSQVSVFQPGDEADAGFAPEFVLADLPLLRGEDVSNWAVAAAQMRPWRPLIISSSTGSEGYRPRLRLDAPARMGSLVTALLPGTIEGRFDRSGRIHLALDFGGLESVSEAALLDGANTAAIEAQSGAWEIVQFQKAEEVSADLWELTGLLRGQAGTDDAMRAGAQTGARFFMLDEAVNALGLTSAEAGLPRNFVVEPAGLPVGQGVTSVSFAGGLRARSPISPVHLSARRETGGIRVNWIRRGRIGADSWLATEIPLTEERERYLVEVLAGGEPVRSAEVNGTGWLYHAADELADFSAPLNAIDLRVSQGGLYVPWGIARTATISLT